MNFIAEIIQGTDHCWSIDFYRYETLQDTVSAASVAMQETEEAHRLRIIEFPDVLRVSVCLCIIGPLQRLLIATRGLINSQCNPREFVGLLRRHNGGVGVDDQYIHLLEHVVRTSWP